jgi:hypothetical protein
MKFSSQKGEDKANLCYRQDDPSEMLWKDTGSQSPAKTSAATLRGG